MINNVIFLAWEKHRRSEQIIKFLNIESYIFESELNRVVKHPFFILKTLYVILLKKPKVLIVQNPSIVLAILACVIKILKIKNYFLIVDSHNSGIFPYVYKNFIPIFIYKFIQKIANITIVTNENLAEKVKINGGRPFVLPDKIPEGSLSSDISLSGNFKILSICTFADDEPIEEIISVGQKLKDGDVLYITGNYKKANPNLFKNLTKSVILTGFLSEEEYWGHLKNVDCILDLTLMEDCLVCGAYEAISVGKPIILSDTEALRRTFSSGAVFTKNNYKSILLALDEVKKTREKLYFEIIKFREEYVKEWHVKSKKLIKIIEEAIQKNNKK